MTDTLNNNLFENGIYLEDLKVLIPWYTDFDSIKLYGNPTVDTITGRSLSVTWDSVKILGGVTITLRSQPYKIFLGKGKYSKLTTLYGTIDERDIGRIKKYLEASTGVPGDNSKTKNSNVYYWLINNCNVRLGKIKRPNMNYQCFFNIQKRKDGM